MKELIDSEIDTYALIAPIVPSVTDADLETLLGAIERSGVKRVMLDRLRLREGMLENLISALGSIEHIDPGLLVRLISSKSYYPELENRVDQICKDLGMECVGAF